MDGEGLGRTDCLHYGVEGECCLLSDNLARSETTAPSLTLTLTAGAASSAWRWRPSCGRHGSSRDVVFSLTLGSEQTLASDENRNTKWVVTVVHTVETWVFQ